MSSVSDRIGLLQKTQSCIHTCPGRPLSLWGTDLCTHSLIAGFHLKDVRWDICYMETSKEGVFMCIRRKKGKGKRKLKIGPKYVFVFSNVELQENTIKGIHRFYNKMNKENFYHTHPVGRKQRCTTLLAYTLTVAVNGTLWDCSKIPSGMLHVIH